MQEIRCSNTKCNKIVGELETGKARFKCKYCSTYTTIEIEPEKLPAPEQDIQQATQWPERARAFVGR
jgi:hypothetical protein